MPFRRTNGGKPNGDIPAVSPREFNGKNSIACRLREDSLAGSDPCYGKAVQELRRQTREPAVGVLKYECCTRVVGGRNAEVCGRKSELAVPDLGRGSGRPSGP